MNKSPFIAAVACLLLGGCAAASAVDVTTIRPPTARCMVAAKALSVPKAGDDLRIEHIELMNDYVDETSKLRCMQSYARALRK